MGGDPLSSRRNRNRIWTRSRFGAAALAFAALPGCTQLSQYHNYSIPAMFNPRPSAAEPAQPLRLLLRDSKLFRGGIRVVKPDRAKLAPEFRFEDHRGNVYTPESLYGHVVWIDLWAEWCATCRAEFPTVQAIHERLEPGVTVLAVCRNSSREGFDAAAAKTWISFPMVDASRQSEFPFPYGAFPTNVVIDRSGRVRAFWQGHRPLDAVEELLTKLLHEPVEELPPARLVRPSLFRPSPPVPADGERVSDSRSVTTASLELLGESVAPGGLVEGAVVLDVRPGWHLTAGTEDGSIPLRIELIAGPEFTLLDSYLPRPIPLTLAGSSREVYSGTVRLPFWGFLRPDLRPGDPARFEVLATVQACDSRSCLGPSEIRLDGEVEVASLPGGAGSDRVDAGSAPGLAPGGGEGTHAAKGTRAARRERLGR